MVAGVHGLPGQCVRQHVEGVLRVVLGNVTALNHSMEEGSVLETPLKMKYATDRVVLLVRKTNIWTKYVACMFFYSAFLFEPPKNKKLIALETEIKWERIVCDVLY